jgi:hypothetical protein
MNNEDKRSLLFWDVTYSWLVFSYWCLPVQTQFSSQTEGRTDKLSWNIDNYLPMLCNIPEEQRSPLHHEGCLKSRNKDKDQTTYTKSDKHHYTFSIKFLNYMNYASLANVWLDGDKSVSTQKVCNGNRSICLYHWEVAVHCFLQGLASVKIQVGSVVAPAPGLSCWEGQS